MAKTALLVAFDREIVGTVAVPDEIDGFPAIIIQKSRFFTFDMPSDIGQGAVNSATDATYSEVTHYFAID